VTEHEWLNCTEPTEMLEFLREKVSVRRLTLFAVAACRQDQWLMEDKRSRQAVEWAEKIVEGVANWGVEEGPSDGDCYLMAGAANRCMGVAGCLADRDTARAIENALTVVELLLEGEEESSQLAVLIHDVFGNPFRRVTENPAWLTTTVVALAKGIYADRAFDRLPILADALQDAGCDNADILNHCRSEAPHVRGCWVVDLLLGKE